VAGLRPCLPPTAAAAPGVPPCRGSAPGAQHMQGMQEARRDLQRINWSIDPMRRAAQKLLTWFAVRGRQRCRQRLGSRQAMSKCAAGTHSLSHHRKCRSSKLRYFSVVGVASAPFFSHCYIGAPRPPRFRCLPAPRPSVGRSWRAAAMVSSHALKHRVVAPRPRIPAPPLPRQPQVSGHRPAQQAQQGWRDVMAWMAHLQTTARGCT
jgi:hypothetical protein